MDEVDGLLNQPVSRRTALASATIAGAALATPDAATAAHPDQSVLFQLGTAPIALRHEGANTAGREALELFNDSGFVLRARAETGEDVQLWMFFYQQRAKEVIVDGDLVQTSLIVNSFTPAERQQMHDTPFINKGQSLEDYFKPGMMKIVESPREVRWSLGGREMICTEGAWQLRGDHAGVRTDIRFTPRGPGFFHVGRFEDLKAQGAAGYQAHMDAEGEIVVDGRVLKVKGYAVHERILLSFPTLPPRLKKNRGAGSNWMHSWGPEFSFYVLNAVEGGHATGMVMLGDKLFPTSGLDKIKVTELDHWIDPKSRERVPRKWHIAMQTPEGDLDATMAAYGRAYYYWLRLGGLMIVHQFMAESEASFTPRGGQPIHSQHLAHNELMRTFYEQ